MAFLDKLSDLAKSAKSGAEDLVETGRLNVRINDEEKKISRIKQQIGQYIWEQYAAGVDGIPQGALEFCRQIDQANEEIANLSMQINVIKSQSSAVKVSPAPSPAPQADSAFGNCFSCGGPLREGDKFCPACGTAQPQPPEEAPVVDVEPEDAPRLCPVCGREMPESAKFCNICGAKLDL
ncbi:MAG: zinc ribbon domain-containing protein [Firmicutes bacterium]|nr:zinc ribbon domain-containing protein [Bacillota bacterium]